MFDAEVEDHVADHPVDERTAGVVGPFDLLEPPVIGEIDVHTGTAEWLVRLRDVEDRGEEYSFSAGRMIEPELDRADRLTRRSDVIDRGRETAGFGGREVELVE